MDEVNVPREEWRFRQRVEELFRGERDIIDAVRKRDYLGLKRLLSAYARMRFSATDVLVAYNTRTESSGVLKRRALRAAHAPDMMDRCDELLLCRGVPSCSECRGVMSPAGQARVCERCGHVTSLDDGDGTDGSRVGDGSGEGGGDDTTAAAADAPLQGEFDDGNGAFLGNCVASRP